jgi:hypothetical protein
VPGERGRDESAAKRILILLLIALAAGSGAWWWYQAARGDLADAGETEPLMQAATEAASDAVSAAANAAAAGPMAAASVPSAAAAAAASEAEADCPAEWRAMAGKSEAAMRRAFLRRSPAALTHAGDLLAASSDPFERVAGHLIAARGRDPNGEPDAAAYLAAVSEGLSGSDPRVAAIAWQLCSNVAEGQAPACASITPQRWAQLEPGNAQAWLAVASDATQRGDEASAHEALSRAARGSSSRLGWSDVLRLAQSPSLQALPAVERELLVIDLIGVMASTTASGGLSAAVLCSQTAVESPQRRRDCGDVAQVLLDHGETLIELGIARAIGKRVGWDDERLNALEQELAALNDALAEATDFSVDADGPMSLAQACAAHRRVARATAFVSSGSEVELARRARK